MDTYLDFPIKCRADFEAIKWRYDPHSPCRYPDFWGDHVRFLRTRDYPLRAPDRWGDSMNSFYGQLRMWMGTEKACTVFYDDPTWAQASGVSLLSHTAELVRGAGFRIANASVQVIGNRPRLGTRRQEAQDVLSAAVGAPIRVSGTTTDGLGLTGRGEGVAAIAVASVVLE